MPRVVGHRGAAASAPENTLAGLRRAHQLGVGWVEFDVKLSGDGVPIVMHDAVLERTTDGKGAVADTAYAAIRALDAGAWFGPEFAGERVPSFDEAIDLLLSHGMSANVEIKACPGRERETGAAVARRLADRWPADRPPLLLSSYAEASLEAAREVAPALPRGLLVRAVPEDWQARVERLGAVSLHCRQRDLDEATVAAVHRAGYPVLAYTVNEPERAAELFGWGVDCICSDRPEAILPLAG
nr:glycerophosphodiester phosphodiesterase [Stella humosa]